MCSESSLLLVFCIRAYVGEMWARMWPRSASVCPHTSDWSIKDQAKLYEDTMEFKRVQLWQSF